MGPRKSGYLARRPGHRVTPVPYFKALRPGGKRPEDRHHPGLLAVGDAGLALLGGTQIDCQRESGSAIFKNRKPDFFRAARTAAGFGPTPAAATGKIATKE